MSNVLSIISKRLTLTALALALTTTSLATGVLAAAPEVQDLVKGHLLVAPRAGVAEAEFHGALRAHGGKVITKLGDLDVYVVTLPEHASERAVAALLAHHPLIKFAEPDRLVAPDLTPNDTYYGNAWHLQMVQAPVAWDRALGSGITVAILDSGVNGAHPDLQGKMVPGWNFYDNNDNTADVHGHGTKVAGVVAAASNNATGVTSVAWNAKLMPIRISAPDGYASWSTVASGLNWAANNGARVANISYGVHGSSTVQSAAQYMKNKGGLVFNSAGNTGAFDTTAANDAMVSVAATNSADTRPSWATWGAYVDLAAPGQGIWTTTKDGGYGTVDGTSFSSPLTAGIAALMMSANTALPPAQIESILKSTAVDVGAAGYDQNYGYGRVNAAAAVQTAATTQYVDHQPPAVAIAAPTAGTVKGVVPVNVTANDNVGVTRVELLVNGSLLAADVAAPYGFSWDTTALADGPATLVARAYDAAGNTADSAGVNVTVSNTTVVDATPPVVNITNPANGSKVSGFVTVTVSSSDNVGVASLNLAIDGVVKVTGNAASISYRWNTKNVKAGVHRLTATATDQAGNRTSHEIQVTR